MDFLKNLILSTKNIVYPLIIILVIGNIITSGIALYPQEFNIDMPEAPLLEELDATMRLWLTYGVTGVYFIGIALFIYFGKKHRS